MDLVAITESWLYNDIDDRLISINGYNIHRKDRMSSLGSGVYVCMYVYLIDHPYCVSTPYKGFPVRGD